MDQTNEIKEEPLLTAKSLSEKIFDLAPAGGTVVLDGWLERNKFNPLLLSTIFIVAAFLLYMIASAIALIALGGVEMVTDPEAMVDRPDLLLLSNAIGQFIGLGGLAWMWAKWNSKSNRSGFLRLRQPDWGLVGIALLGLACLFPIVQWLGHLNEMIPLPEFLRALEEGQVELLEKAILEGELGLIFSLFTLAITPAICEELAFRGYLQRQVERRTSGIAAVFIVGIVFGLFHLRLSQAIPLSVLGIYMGYVTWLTGSLWTAIIIHFANNGFLTLAGNLAQKSEDFDPKALDEMVIPTWVALIAIAIFASVMWWFNKTAQNKIPIQTSSTVNHD